MFGTLVVFQIILMIRRAKSNYHKGGKKIRMIAGYSQKRKVLSQNKRFISEKFPKNQIFTKNLKLSRM